MDETDELTLTNPRPYRPTDVLIAVGAILAFVMNLFTFASLLSRRKLRTNKYYRTVLCLSVGDMIASVCAVHWFVRYFLIHPDSSSDVECMLSFIVVCASLQQTHLQMVLLAAERYIASRGTLKRQRYCKLSVQITYMTLSWAFCVAYMVTNSLYHKMIGANLCYSGQFVYFNDSYAGIGILFVLPIIFSITLVLFLYAMTIVNIRRTSIRVGTSVNDPSNTVSAANRYVLWVHFISYF